MSSLRIIATITAKSDYADQIRQTLENLVTESRKEAGNLSYLLCQDVRQANVFTVLEEWKSQEAIDIHNRSAHFLHFLNAIDGKTDDVRISVVKQIC